jgi:hypothetical protein
MGRLQRKQSCVNILQITYMYILHITYLYLRTSHANEPDKYKFPQIFQLPFIGLPTPTQYSLLSDFTITRPSKDILIGNFLKQI